jgi:hypothetical protein
MINSYKSQVIRHKYRIFIFGIAALSLIFGVLSCTTKVMVTQGPATSPATPSFYLKPVAPITGADNVVDNIGVGKVDWGTGSIKAKGTGVLDPNNPNKAQARVMAERAAVVDAQRNLLETAEGVRVNGETQVKDFMTKSDVITTRVNGLVKGARLTGDPKYDSAMGTVQVEMEISLYDKEGLTNAVAPVELSTKTLENMTPQEKELLQKYSSVVFDASGTGLKPALFPKIYDENGNLLFDTGTYVDTTSEYSRRVVQYVKSLDKILTNPDLQNNPIIIKVKELRGKLDSDIVISNENANKYKWLKDTFQFLLKAGRTFIQLL